MTKEKPMFVVFGATGHTGSIVTERLLAAGKRVVAVVRDPARAGALAARGAELAVGDLTDAAFVERTLAGAEGAYLLAPPDFAAEDLLAKNRRVIDAYLAGLEAAATPHAVFLSSVGAQLSAGTGPTLFSHYGEITLVKASRTRITFVRAPFFMENILGSAHAMRTDGVLPVFGGGEAHRFPMIASRDIADVAADALLAPPSTTEWIELRGPRDYSWVDAAAIASKVLGREVTATPLPLDAVVPILTGAGFSANVAGLFRELHEAIGRGVITYEGRGRAIEGKTELEAVLGRGLA
ncbi:MAG TPA: NmrA family NAD(P)-binding protein [Polyangiaceae bacterium]|nr:NmrA family NAD(P)-binding protein [Polyangiaceae bacterium]